MAASTWARIGAAVAGLGAVAAGVVYLTRTEKGRALTAQAREKAQELWTKARETAAQATTSLQETAQSALGAGEETPEEATAGV